MKTINHQTAQNPKLDLHQSSIILIKDFPTNNQTLINFCKQIGKPIEEPQILQHLLADKYIFDVKINNSQISTWASTNSNMDCHTDGSYITNVPDIVVLLCVKPALRGGETLLISVDTLYSKLTPIEVMKLQHIHFPFRGHFFPILTKSQNEFFIRYSRMIIEATPNSIKANIDSNLLDKIDAIIAEYQNTIKLEKGDCLILNNKKILHGRSAFDYSSDRHLKRIRLSF